ncbi:hypothetical protein ACFVOK_09980 [Streptomyces sp. NPDC057798]|uniref:hypothetical protein n=1 Tax=Streptomyces sp. NPDC057798 TaxID=3346252 RepID=UPI00367BBEB5
MVTHHSTGQPGLGDLDGAPVRLTFISPQGTRQTVLSRLGAERRRTTPPPLTAHDVLLGGSVRAVRLSGAADGADEEGPRKLEAEIRAALCLHRAFHGSPYQSLFPSLVGYDMDAEEPFVLYQAPRGDAAAQLGYGISTTEQRTIERDLVLAVRLLEGLGLVHRGLVPAAVRWDGKRAQIWDLGAVARVGSRRVPLGVPPYAAPEQRHGVGRADARDALWSVAQIVYQLATGQQGDPEGPPRDLAAYRSLERPLGDAFAPLAEDRPAPAEVLALLMPGPDPAALVEARPDPLEPHRQDYDRAMERKRRDAGLGPYGYGHGVETPAAGASRASVPPQETRGRRRAWFGGHAGGRDARGQ